MNRRTSRPAPRKTIEEIIRANQERSLAKLSPEERAAWEREQIERANAWIEKYRNDFS